MDNINFDEYLKKHSPGYVIEIYKDNEEQEYVLGNSQIIPKITKTTPDTLYDIASLTKVFTCVLIYMAYEENKIDLYDTVYNVDNNFINLKNTKIIDLLSHNQDIWTKGYLGSINSKEEFYDTLYTSYVKDNTETYIDTHYIILGIILEKIYGRSYQELCEEKIIKPLNMKHTTFNPNPEMCASNNYEHQDNREVTDIYPGLIHDTKGRIAKKYGLNLGHASIFTTGSDLLTFLKTFLNNRLLKKETITIMLTHRDTNEKNYQKLHSITNETDINIAYNIFKKEYPNIKIPRTYNNMGVRYHNNIDELNDVPTIASDNTIVFSGYTGPMFAIDFDNNIIAVIMCNVVHNSYLSRETRKNITTEIMNKIFANLLK